MTGAITVSETEVQKVLRLAFLYGALEVRNGRVYVRGSPGKPVCRFDVADAMVQRGWLKPNDTRYEITDEGKRVEQEFGGYH